MDMEFLNGMMDKFLKDNGEWELKMVMEFGLESTEATIKENGI